MKKRIIITSIILSLFSILAFNTIAYFSAKETVTNVITTGSVDLEIIELTDDGVEFPLQGIERVTPGSVVIKNVSIKNSGKNPMWLRVKAEKNFENLELNPEVASLDFNLDDWILKDGWYYYKLVVLPNQLTNQLFNTVTFSLDDMSNEYQDETFTINIIAESVQSENNGLEPTLAFGWEE